MRKLRNFYEKVTDFLWENYLISKTLQIGGVVACGIRGRRILKSTDWFFTLFYFLDELLTISARSQTASPPSGETGER